MGRKKLCVIVIFCTISCVCIMLSHWNKYVSPNYNGYKEEVNSKVNTKGELESDNKKQNNTSVKIDNKVAEKKKIANDKIVVKEKVNDDNTDVRNSSEKDLINNSNGSENEETYAAAFKVSKNEIMSSLSLIDKGRILIIASKLSTIDYKKIQELLKIGDEKGIITAIKLLKEKLSEKDYNKIRGIAEKFLNMEMVENQIH